MLAAGYLLGDRTQAVFKARRRRAQQASGVPVAILNPSSNPTRASLARRAAEYPAEPGLFGIPNWIWFLLLLVVVIAFIMLCVFLYQIYVEPPAQYDANNPNDPHVVTIKIEEQNRAQAEYAGIEDYDAFVEQVHDDLNVIAGGDSELGGGGEGEAGTPDPNALEQAASTIASMIPHMVTPLAVGFGVSMGISWTKGRAKMAIARLSKMSARFAVKATMTGMKILAKLATVAGAVLAVLDVVSLLWEAWDAEGYANFTENKANVDFIKAASLAIEDHCKQNDIPYPLVFPWQDAVGKAETDAVNQALMARFWPADEIVTTMASYDAYAAALEANPNMTVAQEEEYEAAIFVECDAVYQGRLEEGYLERDNIIFDTLQSHLDAEHRKYIVRNTHMTAPKRIGVSLSKAGVAWYNKKQQANWEMHNDLFLQKCSSTKDPKPHYNCVPDREPGNDEPMAAMWTRSYFKAAANQHGAGGGSDENARSEVAQLAADTAIMLPIGPVFAFCTKTKTAKNLFGLGVVGTAENGRAVDPKEYGVRMNDGTLGVDGTCTPAEVSNTNADGTAKNPNLPRCIPRVTCIYSKRFCTRMGLNHHYNHAQGFSECKSDAGLVVADAIGLGSAAKAIKRAFERECKPPCKVYEYCDAPIGQDAKCKPKKAYGEHVGPNGSEKCLSGSEAYSKCVECRDGRNGGSRCDGNHNEKATGGTLSGANCSQPGSCYCGDAWGSPEYDKCVLKKDFGAHVGPTADYKCKSGYEAFSKCVECRDGRNGTSKCNNFTEGRQKNYNANDPAEYKGRTVAGKRVIDCGTTRCYCGDGGEGHDQCIAKRPNGYHVGWTAGYKCRSQKEWDGKCINGAMRLEGKTCHHDNVCASNKCHWGRCAAERGRPGHKHCAWWNGNRCPGGGYRCHHEWCIRFS